MDLFDMVRERTLVQEAPLAARMRPETIDEVVGQQHIIGEGKLLYRAIKADKLGSLIFYGPPGTGKTTLARVIANTTEANFRQLNATVAGKKDIQEVVKEAKETLGMSMTKTILFIDEIHRFNKAQQDALLPFVEDGTLTLIGATTENPYFEVNKALVSRSRIFQLEPLGRDAIMALLRRTITHEKGLRSYNLEVDDDALEFIADIANGDARVALNAIELGALTTDPVNGAVSIDLEVAEACIQKRAINYDKNGDNHYDVISAFIKSMRGSDPDAAVYYLARMLYAGEDIKFIARRLVICASEDVGNADPQALVVANSAAQAVQFVGMPEAQIILSQAVQYIATAPKSNSSLGIFSAMEDVRNIQVNSLPNHLKDAHYQNAKDLGHGVDYVYPHDFEDHFYDQQYLPDELVDRVYYQPSDQGYEKTIRDMMASRTKGTWAKKRQQVDR